MRETPYDAENVLQELIERHPEMLAGEDSAYGSLVLVRREAGVSDDEDAGARWSLDHLYLDSNGVPTLVEVKRSSDTRSRREVVAQMLEYAANARTSFDVKLMAEWLEESARRRGSTAAETLLDAFDVDDVAGFWESVDTNVKAERFRLVFVSDRIGAELRRIIEYLNRQMSPTEVLAIEVKQYTDAEGEHQTIVPRLVGDTAEARAAKRPTSRAQSLDRETLVASIRERSAPAAEAAEAILDWADHEPRLDVRYTPTSAGLWTADSVFFRVRRNAEVRVWLSTLSDHGAPWDDERIEQFVEDLADIGVQLGPNRNRPKARLEPLAEETRRRQFLTLMERALDTMTASS